MGKLPKELVIQLEDGILKLFWEKRYQYPKKEMQIKFKQNF